MDSIFGSEEVCVDFKVGLNTNYRKFIIYRLRRFEEEFMFFKVKIKISQNECFTPESTRSVISEASKLGQIGGIFHLTLVLNDCLVENSTFDKFCESIDTKYKIFNNLDVDSRKLGYNFDYFVVFSSISCAKKLRSD